jgi:hypothetical protein
LPLFYVTGVDCVSLEFTREAHTIAAARKAMRSLNAATEDMLSTITSLGCLLFG